MKIVLFLTGRPARGRGWSVVKTLSAEGHNPCRLVSEIENVNGSNFLSEMRNLTPDLFIVAGFPQIFKKPLLEVPKFGVWNCHAGPVPEYRGGSPLNWQIIDGKSVLGVSLLKMDEGIDTGEVISQAKFALLPDETIADAHRKTNELFAELVLDALRNFDKLAPRPQVGPSAYRPQRSDEDGEIDLSWPADTICDFVRALTHPYPGAWIRVGDEKVRIWSASKG